MLSPIVPRTGDVPFHSTVTGQVLDTARLDAEYWYRGERQTVRFDQVIRALLEGHRRWAFIEISPHPVLTVGVQDTIDAIRGDHDDAMVVGSLRRDRAGLERFLSALGELHVRGVDVQWGAVLAGSGAHRRVDLPGGAEDELGGAVPVGSFVRDLAGASARERDRAALELVRAQAAIVLGHDSAAAVPPKQAFKELGFDSSAAVELRNRLRALTGLSLPTTLLFDHPTPTALAGRLLDEITGARGEVTVSAPALAPAAYAAEPIAIVGMGCRYPGGVCSPEQLWELVVSGGDAVAAFPADRGWDLDGLYDPDPEHPGTSYAREGGFLYDAAEFDAGFFGISPREAMAMDPQQRLLLEVAWEACEDAGIAPGSLQGSETGVFVGAMTQDYGSRLHEASQGYEGYTLTGNTASVISGRLSYAFGLQGPAVTVDTACSSSLVALHLACQALNGGECALALSGGAAVMTSPGMFIEFSRQRGLAPDGRCKSFAQAADGTGWSEGVGVVLLERLSDARRLGHPVLALVRGSAVNQDGASNGLTAPNGPSQRRVIARALAAAQLSAADVDVVEAHGTGTTLGDPIEAQALLATYGQGRARERPLWLGSVKSNIGHTQAAAGVAGVIKMVMAMRHGVLPKTLHVDQPSQQVDWSAGAMSLLTEAQPWLGGAGPRRAGVSSFGISGTNAHAILEEAPGTVLADSADRTSGGRGESGDSGGGGGRGVAAGVGPWIISARSESALREQAQRLHAHVDGDPALRAVDVGHSLVAGRSQFAHRAVALGAERGSLLDGIGALAQGEPVEGVIEGVAGIDGEVAFLFPGQGSQWEGMAVELLDSSPLFVELMGACGEALAPLVDWSLEAVLRAADGAPGLDRVDVLQPVSFAVMVSLAGLWRAHGVNPDVVVGHSQGEIAAAYVAGGLSLPDAARVVALRSKALARLSGEGGMVSVSLQAGPLAERLEGWGERLAIAAINGPSSVAVSGDCDALDELLQWCQQEGVRARRIPVDYASHSAQVQAIREELLDVLSPIAPRSGEIPFYSTVTGELLDTAALDGDYWYRSLRQTVQFERATRAVLTRGARAFIEVSSHPVLTLGVQETVEQALGVEDAPGVEQALGSSEDVVVAGSLRRGQGGLERFLTSLAEVWVRGVAVDWTCVFAASGAERVKLPTYAFQRERYWLDVSPGQGNMVSAGQASADHPLLGAAVGLADGQGWLFTARLSLASHPWLADHAVMGVVLLPGTAFLELALHAGRRVGCGVVRELTLEVPLVLSERGAVQLQLSLGEADGSGLRTLSIHSRPEHVAGAGERSGDAGEWSGGAGERSEGAWICHAHGVLSAEEAPDRERRERVQELAGVWPPERADAVNVDDLYERLAQLGLDYGPAFQGLRAAWRRGGEVFAEVCLAADQQTQAALFGVHPALLDAALHPIGGGLLREDASVPRTLVELPFSWSGVSLSAAGASRLRVRLSSVGTAGISLLVADENGTPVASIDSLVSRAVSREQLAGARGSTGDSLLRLDWIAVPVEPAQPLPAGDWMVLGAAGQGVVGALQAAGERATALADLASLGDALDVGGALGDVVLLDCTRDAAEPAGAGMAGTGMADAAHGDVHRVLELAQAWLADERFSACRLVLVTRGAVAVRLGEDVPGLAQAPVWGLVRSAQSENPGRFVLVDLDDQQASWRALPAALASGEPQLAVRDGGVFVPRLAVAAAGAGAALTPPADAAAWRLDITAGRDTLENLALVACPEATAPLEPGQVRVAVRAAGLNFRDVLIALGVVSGPRRRLAARAPGSSSRSAQRSAAWPRAIA